MNWTVSLVLCPCFDTFIAKNHLASEDPLAFSTCGHSCFESSLLPSLVQDKSLCSVRALRYYLDKAKDLRRGKNFLL